MNIVAALKQEEKSLQHQLRAVQNALAALNVLPNGAPRNWFLSEAISTQTDLVCCSKNQNLIRSQGTLGEVKSRPGKRLQEDDLFVIINH